MDYAVVAYDPIHGGASRIIQTYGDSDFDFSNAAKHAKDLNGSRLGACLVIPTMGDEYGVIFGGVIQPESYESVDAATMKLTMLVAEKELGVKL